MGWRHGGPCAHVASLFHLNHAPCPLPPPQVVGCYVGFATVGAFATWYTSTSFLGIDLSQVRCSMCGA